MKNCTFNWSTCCNVEGILTHRESLEFPSRRLRCSVQRKRYTQRTERDGEYEKINKNKSRRKLSHVNYKSSFIAIRSVSFGGRFFWLQFCWSLFFFLFCQTFKPNKIWLSTEFHWLFFFLFIITTFRPRPIIIEFIFVFSCISPLPYRKFYSFFVSPRTRSKKILKHSKNTQPNSYALKISLCRDYCRVFNRLACTTSSAASGRSALGDFLSAASSIRAGIGLSLFCAPAPRCNTVCWDVFRRDLTWPEREVVLTFLLSLHNSFWLDRVCELSAASSNSLSLSTRRNSHTSPALSLRFVRFFMLTMGRKGGAQSGFTVNSPFYRCCVHAQKFDAMSSWRRRKKSCVFPVSLPAAASMSSIGNRGNKSKH